MDSYGFLRIPEDYYNVLWIPNDHVAEKQVMALSVVIDNAADQFTQNLIIWDSYGFPMILMDS